MITASIVGLDLAKSVFQVHGADTSGAVIFRKKLSREELLPFFSTLSPCLVAMETCGSSHYWAREIASIGHDTRLIPAAYVKPFVKICEAAQRPTMRFVAAKGAEAQAAGMIFRMRDLLVSQRTQLINALRGHLMEFGYVVQRGTSHVGKLIKLVDDPNSDIPIDARRNLNIFTQSMHALQAVLAYLDREIANRANADPVAKRLMTIPGVGPMTATAMVALAPPPSFFRCGRDFAAWLGLTPRQHSSGGRERLGRASKMGNRTLRQLLILGARSALGVAARDSTKASAWLTGMLSRKPRMLVIVALANKMARIIWALMAHGGSYRAPSATV
jgi:transposase